MRTVMLALVASVALPLIHADLVECENGDRYNGKVLLVDEHNVKLQNDITGVLSIPRSKVSTITFGAPKPVRSTTAARPNAQTNVVSPGQPFQFDPAAVEQIQNQILGGAPPEAAEMYQEMLRGLVSGKLDLGDIRAKAQSTLDELKTLQKELGDDDTADLLGSYASILENFVKQAPPAKTPPAAKKPGADAAKEKDE